MAKKLEAVIPAGIFVGTSLILRRGQRFLYGMRASKEENGRSIMELTGIGGKVEKEDATYTAAVLREAREETGCAVRLLDCGQTLLVRNRDEIERLALEGEKRPAAVVYRKYGTPPHRPWHASGAGELCVIVFAGELLGSPRPTMELPWLIWLKAPQILQTAREDLPLSALLEEGAEVVAGKEKLPSEACFARLTDSQEALGIALDDDFYSLYG